MNRLAERIRSLTFAAVTGLATATGMAQTTVELHWLGDTAPHVPQGVTWGVPWADGQVSKDARLSLTDAKGSAIPIQTWPLAYWPDGSVKWTACAIAPSADIPMPLQLSAKPAKVASEKAISVDQDPGAITIHDGDMDCRIPTSGAALIDSITLGGKKIAQDGKLVASLMDGDKADDFSSQIDKVTLEQQGPVRAVVKIEGKHHQDDGQRAMLPFVIRLYFYAGSHQIRMVHSFIFDGDGDKDFIHLLGVRFDVPMHEEFQNRHVRFAGESGCFAEPVQLIVGRRDPGHGLYARQLAGQRIPNLADMPGTVANPPPDVNPATIPGPGRLIAQMAVWDDYKLDQLSADSFVIQKRTSHESAYINAAAGNRSLGLEFAGDVSGGLAIGLKNFWQLCPTEMEIKHASKDSAQMTMWLWSPDSPAMDVRHYDTKAHGLEASYEDVQPGFSTATGVARTSELTIEPFSNVPSDRELWNRARDNAQPPLLVCKPEYYHAIPIFGLWSLPDRSTPAKRWMENELNNALFFYQTQVDERNWYGFWDFGDVMHTYDTPRHSWRYDVGGFAWADTELMPNLWLWYSFLRTGRPDIYRMAEAMTRQSQECDVYHIGPFAGLGSRHNVRHWGDGAKEMRISQDLLKRFYYYLTADERTGDLMNEETDADFKLVDVDPLREIEKKTQYPTHIRVGPDWFAAVSNWLTDWERTGDTKYRDKILVGMKCLAEAPHKLFAESFAYDPKTGMIYPIHNDRASAVGLAALFGGPELNFEIVPLMNNPQWTDAWMQYCEYLNAPADEQKKVLGNVIGTGRNDNFARMAAYAAYVNKDKTLADRAWQQFLHGDARKPGPAKEPFAIHVLNDPSVPVPYHEIDGVSTNQTSQWCLNAIELLQMVGDDIPEADPMFKTGSEK